MRKQPERPTDDVRRAAVVCLASFGTLALYACSPHPDSEPKPSASAVVFNLEKVKAALDALSGAVDALQAAVGGFDTEDWKDVVPQVQSSSTDVADTLEKLKQLMAGNPAD